MMDGHNNGLYSKVKELQDRTKINTVMNKEVMISFDSEKIAKRWNDRGAPY